VGIGAARRLAGALGAMNRRIPHRNRSPHGWWVATYIERAAWDDEPNPGDLSRCLAWENTVIFQAPDREAAYAKALVLGAQNSSRFADSTKEGRSGHWVFEGLTSLLPIYDELKDGTEILWTEHRNRTVGKIRSWVRRKEDLEAFEDTPAEGDGA
jgi:Domain of unknown function (DUF4288)